MCSVRKFKRRMLVYSSIVLVTLLLIAGILSAIYYAGRYNAIKNCCNPSITCNDK